MSDVPVVEEPAKHKWAQIVFAWGSYVECDECEMDVHCQDQLDAANAAGCRGEVPDV